MKRCMAKSRRPKRRAGHGNQQDILREILAELAGLRADLQRYVANGAGDRGVIADAPVTPATPLPLVPAARPFDDRPGGTSAANEEAAIFAQSTLPLHSGAAASTSDQRIDPVAIVHQNVVDAGRAKRVHRPINLLVSLYNHLSRQSRTHAIANQERWLFDRSICEDNPSDANYVRDMLRLLRDHQCVEAAMQSGTLTDPMRRLGRQEAPVHQWRLTQLGIDVAIRELEARGQRAAAEQGSRGNAAQ